MAAHPNDGVSPSSPNTSAFPTFLANDPFPSNPNGRPVSSAASDATSDFDAGPAYRVPSITGPVGEPGLPPSRPLSGASAGTEYSQRGGMARTSLPVPPSRRSVGRKDASGSRSGATVNRSHVPSLAAAGFSRPMSPQRLQAQRGQNVRTGAASPDPAGEHRRRESDASVKTLHDAPPDLSNAPPLPVSRGTVHSAAGDALAVGAVSLGSKDSTTPLYARQQLGPSRGGAGALSSNLPTSQLTTRSNRSSLRASLGLPSRHSSRRDDRISPGLGHEKLPSGPASPIMVANEKASPTSARPKSKAANGRNYEYYAGNLIFFGSGLCLNTRAQPLNLITFVLVALPVGLFAGFSAPWLWLHVSPAIPIVFAYIFFVTISSFLHAAFTDPGILPRNIHPQPPNPEEERDPLAIGPPTTEWIMVKTFAQRKSRSTASDAENGAANASTTAMEVPTKYCKSCNIWRPPRAHHCRICDACIETQDHHCVWLNNCVGRRNYRYFFTFVGFASLLALALIAFSLLHVALYAQQNHISFGASLSGRTNERIAFAMFLYALLALPYPGSLFVYHLFLTARGETTREYLNSHKFQPSDRHRPFTQSRITANWAAVLLRPRNASSLAFHARYADGDLRFGHTRPRSVRISDARREAADRQRKVEGLRNRFSIAKEKVASEGPTGTGSTISPTAPSADMEMRKLPSSRGSMTPHPPPSSAGPGAAEMAGGGGRVKKGLLNRTPRS